MRDIIVAATQFQHIAGDKEANLAIIERMATTAAARGVEILAFPECCVTGYWHLRNLDKPDLAALAEAVPAGPTCQRLLALSAELQMTIGAGMLEAGEDGRLFNNYFVAMSDGTWANHRKLHCFVHPELASGDQYTVFDTPHGCKVGVLICYDNNLVENTRCTALAGAEILLAPHQTGGCDSRSPHAMGKIPLELWERRDEDPESLYQAFRGDKGRGWLMRWLPARAHDNGMFLVFSNGVGADDDEVRTGNAMVLDPYGRIIAESVNIEDDMVLAKLDASLRDRATGVRWLKARRPELYGPLIERLGNELDPHAARFT
ncbi:MAG: nitrilase-related carbon-nitrogen hydrolase [Pirellulaceae bacterium]